MIEKKKVQETWLGYYPFTVCVGARYSKLYHDTRRTAGAHGQVGHGHDMATTRLTTRTIQRCDTAGLHAGASDLAKGESRYKNCIVAGGDRLCHNMAQQGYDTTLRHGNSVLLHGPTTWPVEPRYGPVRVATR